MTTDDLLPMTLAMAVPAWMDEIKDWSAEQRAIRARETARTIAEHGDDILYPSREPGGTATAFNALAEGLAIAASAPGGVTAFGQHWRTDHAACKEAGSHEAESGDDNA